MSETTNAVDCAARPIPSRLRAAAWLWTLVILVLCWIPASLLPIREAGPRAPRIAHLDKFVHAALFGGFGVLWAVAHPPRRWPQILAVGLGLAVLTEIGQATPLVARDANLADALADAFGLAAGLGLTTAARSLRSDLG